MVNYSTTDLTRWGTGLGLLQAVQVDESFWELEERILTLEQAPGGGANGISSIQVIGSQMTIFTDDGTAHGPYTLPRAMIRYRGEWAAATTYSEMDLVLVSAVGLYLVLRAHTSTDPFDPEAVDVNGNPLYQWLLPVEGSSGIEDAPSDGNIYARRDGSWVTFGISVAWNEITGKPATFPPSQHFHTFLSLTDTPAAFGSPDQILSVNPSGNGFIWVDRTAATGTGITDAPSDNVYYVRYNSSWVQIPGADWANIANKPATFPPAEHSHSWDSVTSKPTEFPPVPHGHAWTEVGSKPAAVDALPPDLGLPGDSMRVASDGQSMEWYNSGVAQSNDFKDSVRLATTANIPLTGVQTIEGIATATGDRILVKDQLVGSENGLYAANDAGAWTRTTDADTDAEVTSGFMVFVEQGATNGNKTFALFTPDPITVGTTTLTFKEVASPISQLLIKPINVKDYTITPKDLGRWLMVRGLHEGTDTDPNIIRIPPMAAGEKWPRHAEVVIHQRGPGPVTIVAGTGVAIWNPHVKPAMEASITLPYQDATVRLKVRGTDGWLMEAQFIPGDVGRMDTMTQAEYDALTTKDANTLYLITE